MSRAGNDGGSLAQKNQAEMSIDFQAMVDITLIQVRPQNNLGKYAELHRHVCRGIQTIHTKITNIHSYSPYMPI